MFSWGSTPRRSAISTLTALWGDGNWRSSAHAERIRSVLTDMLDDGDDVARFHATQHIVLLQDDVDAGLRRVIELLQYEEHLAIATVLLSELARFRDSKPDELDRVLGALAERDPWRTLLEEPERQSDSLDSVGQFTGLALYLAIARQMPRSIELTERWFGTSTMAQAAQHALRGIRPWLELPDSRREERDRAFALLRLAANMLTTSEDEHDMRASYHRVDSIVQAIYFASGAFAGNGEKPTTPPSGFVAPAMDVLEALQSWKHPAITHHVVQTLDHLSAQEPRRAFLLIAAAIKTGDSYTHDRMAADTVIALITRYLAEHRDLVTTDPNVLTGVRSILDAFVTSGWPSAVQLAYSASEAFR